MNKDKTTAAIRAFEEALDEDRAFSGSAEDFLTIIRYYHRENFLELALEAADEASKQHPGCKELFLIKARILIEMHQEAPALHLLAGAGPGSPDIELLKARALTCMGRYEEALELLDELKEGASRKVWVDACVAEAYVYECRQEHERAFFLLREALVEDTRNQLALERVAVCIDLTRQYEESISLHEALLDADPYSHLAWYNLGQARAALGQYEEAVQAFEYAFLACSTFEPAYLDCGELCLQLGRPAQALQYFMEALERFEPHPELNFQIGCCYEAMKQYDRAADFFSNLLKQDPFDEEVLYRIGCCHAGAGRWKKAVQAFYRAIDMDDQREEFHLALAEALEKLGQRARAALHYATAHSLAPDSEVYALHYARFLLFSLQCRMALLVIESVAQLHEDNARLHWARVACLFSTGRRAEALYRLGEAFELYPQDVSVLWEWAPELTGDADVQKVLSCCEPVL